MLIVTVSESGSDVVDMRQIILVHGLNVRAFDNKRDKQYKREYGDYVLFRFTSPLSLFSAVPIWILLSVQM